MIDSSFTQQIHTFSIAAVQTLIAENPLNMCVCQDVELAVTHCVCVCMRDTDRSGCCCLHFLITLRLVETLEEHGFQ